ncbi:MAG: 2'-5' RNA ligase family protein [bacterium]
MQAENDQLRAKYSDMWRTCGQNLRTGNYDPDSIPSHGDRRWGLSLVLRIGGSVRETLQTELAMLAKLRRSPHLVYEPEHLHSTVRSLEGYQDHVPASQIDHYVDQLRRVSRGLPQIEIGYAGISGSAAGIFACGYPSQSLNTLRQRLHEDQLPFGALGMHGPEASFVRNNAHISLMVFRAPANAETEIADYVADRSDAVYGKVRVTSLSLVRYRPTLNSVGLTDLASIPL